MAQNGNRTRDTQSDERYERAVLRAFLDGERLREVPAHHKKRLVILRWLADSFEFGRRYEEAEVNLILWRRHSDTASLRRELVDNAFMRRDHGVYWRIPREDMSQERTAQ